MRLKRLFFIHMMILAFMADNAAARAESYAVEVRQIDPQGWTYSATCDVVQNKVCHVFMGIKPKSTAYLEKDIELDVGVMFKNGFVHFQFKSGQDYFCTADGSKIFQMPIAQEERMQDRVKLYAPHPLSRTDPEASLVFRPSLGMVAALEITVRPAPD